MSLRTCESQPFQPYFMGPFAVRNANGQPYDNQTPKLNRHKKWRSVHFSTDTGFVHEQRKQRVMNSATQEANIQAGNKDNPTMENDVPLQAPKRKHSTGSSPRQPTKRSRTFSEPKHDGQVTIIRELVPGDPTQPTKMSIETPNSLQLNPFFGGLQTPPSSEHTINESSRKPNPLFVRRDELENFGLIYDTSNRSGESVKVHADSTESAHGLDQPKESQTEFQPAEEGPEPLNQLTSFGLKDPYETQPAPDDLFQRTDGTQTFASALSLEDINKSNADVQRLEELYAADSNESLSPFSTPPVCGAEIPSNEMCTTSMAVAPSPIVEQSFVNESAMSESCAEQSRTGHSKESPIPVLEPGQCSIQDQQFVSNVKAVLKSQSKWKAVNVARRSARRIGQLLELAQPPDTSEALFLSGDDAAEQVRSGNYFPGPIITENQQPLPLQSTTEFLEEFYDDTAKVWIQDPGILLSRNIPHARVITIEKLKHKFLQPSAKARIPWNCLEMATHVEDGLRPMYLNGEDCRLLTKLKLPNADDSVSRRGYEAGWKEVEKWALLAQGGALTEPHQDSHGYSTFITVNQGTMGFGWLSNPTPEERTEWRNSAATFTGGRWRFVVLRPGQTIFFPSGTVHFVFRLASLGDTLAFGGHVLRCSQIVRWVETMLEEKANSGVTNEELSVSAPAYLERVEKFVKQAKEKGDAEKWGGAEAVDKFLQLKAEFMNAA